MKFLSVTVFVIFTYVPVTYSYNAGLPSWKPIESQNTYLNSNIQNAYQSNGPVLQPVKDPVNIPIANPTSRSNDIYKTQPSPIQYGNQIGPSIPYQVPQNVPVTRSIQQTPLQRDGTATLPVRASPLNYSPTNLNLKAIYEASKPTKQYTIVHLNGTVEHTNDLEAIAARHPNFVMLNAADVLANKYAPVPNFGIYKKTPPVQTAPIPVQQPAANVQQVTAANQNVGRTLKSSYQRVYNNQQPIPIPQAASSVSNPSPIHQSISSVKSQQYGVGATFVPISAPPNFQQPIPLTKQQIQRYPTNTYTGGSNSQSTIQNSNGAVLPTTPNTVPSQTVSPLPNYNRGSLYTSIFPFKLQNGNTIYNQNPNSQVASQIVTKDLHKNAVASNPSTYYPTTQQQNTQNIPSSVSFGSPNISQGKYNNLPTTKNLHENAIAANPLPIYPETSVPIISKKSTISKEPLAIGAAVAQPASLPDQQPLNLPNNNQNIILTPQIITDKNEAIKALNSNLYIPYTNEQNRSSTINIPVSTNPIEQTSPSIVEHSTLPIILPKEQPQEKQPPTITQELDQIGVTQDTVNELNTTYNIISMENKTADPITKITTSEESTVLKPSSKNIIDSSTANTVANTMNAQPTNKTNDKTNVTIDNTKSLEMEPINKPKIETDNYNSTIQSVSNDSSITSTTDKPWSWLTLNEDSIWNLVRNNTQNVYFFFMPPRPKVTKESKTIIFANGTTVEEVTETVVDIGPDGEPKMTITTTKSYS